ncbi:NAD(P)-dependent alcohol dehydrogenase [Nonomuraea sp. NPDC048916]|uniref:NAD(P)-dependent alcohol dehydrogenase n=1 Tax=Nonomuraea sp. NPDC048916 TaxID=3154232 RepID=UPI0034093FE3
MKAIVQDRYGSPDVLKLEDIDRPVPGDHQVLVEVYAAGVDRGVDHLMTGLPYLLRLGFGLRAPRDRVRGRELAGRVEAVGKNVTRFRPGDEVFGIGEGTFAAYACARERKLARKPANLTFEQAAAVTISAITALQAIRDSGEVKPGQKVLVTGAGGGVGTFAVQLAKAFGAEVTGVCSTAKTELVRSIGADHVIDYTREDFTRGGRRYDLILDLAGNRPLSRLRCALTPRGTLVLGGGEDGGRWLGGMERSLGAVLLSPFVGQRLRMLMASERGEDLERLRELAEAGEITPVIGGTYPLSEAPEAMRQLAAGQARGKLVITVRG